MKPQEVVDFIDELDEARVRLESGESVLEVLQSLSAQAWGHIEQIRKPGFDLGTDHEGDVTVDKLCQITDKFSAQHPSVYEHPFREPDLALTIRLSFDPNDGEWEAKIPGKIQDIGQYGKYTLFGPNKRRKDLIQKAREELLRRFRTSGHG